MIKQKNKTKNITTRHGPNRTIRASNGRSKNTELNSFIILIEGDINKNVISIYMKCGNIPLLWRKFFLKIANNRDYLINDCNKPLKKLDRLCRDWYLSHNSDDNEIRVLDDNLNNNYMLM